MTPQSFQTNDNPAICEECVRLLAEVERTCDALSRSLRTHDMIRKDRETEGNRWRLEKVIHDNRESCEEAQRSFLVHKAAHQELRARYARAAELPSA